MMSAPAKPSGAEYADPEVLYRFLEKHPVGPDYVRRTASWLAENYPVSWPAMRPRILQIYRAEVKRVSPSK